MENNRTPVKSSAIISVGYDPETKLMQVEMTGGNVYDYPDVDAADHKDFMASDSMGKHLSKHIRPKYSAKK